MMLSRDDLKEIVILSHLTDAMRDRLLPYIDILQFQNGDLVFKQNTPAVRFYMLRRGKIILEQDITELVTACVGSIKPGYSFGWSAMLEHEIYTADAVCVEPCEVYSFKKEKIIGLFAQEPDIGMRIYQRLLVIIKKRYDNRTEQFRQAIVNHPDMVDLFCT
jgi:CRP-like cAMP-binding protein